MVVEAESFTALACLEPRRELPPSQHGGPSSATNAEPLAAAVCSRIDTALPASVTPKISKGAFVPGSRPQ
jgi:hypothetical protein